MSANYTDLTILIDRSGSMSSLKRSMESALEEFLEAQKSVEGSANVSVYTFDSDHNNQMQLQTLYEGVPLSAVGKITIEPRGGTPLYDAQSEVIDRTGKRLSNIPKNSRPNRVVFITITDGENNTSRLSAANVKAKVDHQQNHYQWNFLFLGASQDSYLEGSKFGIMANKACNYAATQEGTKELSRSLHKAVRGLRTANVATYQSMTNGDIDLYKVEDES